MGSLTTDMVVDMLYGKNLRPTAVAYEAVVLYDHDNDNGERESAVSRNARHSSLMITEPDPNDEFTMDKKHAYMSTVLATYTETLFDKAKHHLGYPFNFDFNYGDLAKLLHFPINNVGDPFIESNYGLHSRQFEVGVLDWFANLWEIEKDDYWGYVTNGGTEGNFHGIFMGRETLPNGILYASNESHYSVFKAARMLRMDCIKVKTIVSGEIDCADFKSKLVHNKDRPAIVNVNIGTTVKGAIDDLDLVIQTLEECDFPRNRFYIHCDGALFGLMLPFVKQAPKITFKKPIGSASISGHKFLGSPMPCGVQITRIEHINALSSDVEYIASRDATITGSRNGHAPIFLWYALNKKGYIGLQTEVQNCLLNANYLKDRLIKAGISAILNELSNTVVFERPLDQELIRQWQLACQGNIAHVIVMPNVSKEKLDAFIDELVKKRSTWYDDGPHRPPCVASEIGNKNCVCPLHGLRTVKGAIDDLNLVIQTLEECGFSRNRFYIHCDAALFGLMLPFIEQAPKITFRKPIDSVSVSGHKLLGCPAPCGVLITRIKYINALSKNVEYIASRDATISCSRNGHAPIFLWYILNKKGSIGLHKDVQKCLHNARYLKNRLKGAGISTMLNELSNIVVFERPPDEDFIRRWQLSCQGNIAHVVVMLNVSKEKLDNFLEELIKKHATWFKNGSAHQPPCVASDIGRENCLCPLHK